MKLILQERQSGALVMDYIQLLTSPPSLFQKGRWPYDGGNSDWSQALVITVTKVPKCRKAIWLMTSYFWKSLACNYSEARNTSQPPIKLRIVVFTSFFVGFKVRWSGRKICVTVYLITIMISDLNDKFRLNLLSCRLQPHLKQLGRHVPNYNLHAQEDPLK